MKSVTSGHGGHAISDIITLNYSYCCCCVTFDEELFCKKFYIN